MSHRQARVTGDALRHSCAWDYIDEQPNDDYDDTEDIHFYEKYASKFKKTHWI